MSYILDALKKAEADRDPDTRARLAFEQRERRRHRFVIYAVLGALIANAVILLWLFLPDTLLEPDATSRAEAPRAALPATAVIPTSPTPEPAAPPDAVMPAPAAPPVDPGTTRQPQARPVPAPLEPARPEPATATETDPTAGPSEIIIGPRSTVASTSPVSLASLPDATRRRFPALSFSTHIYADEPDLRAVVVNGQRLREGDRLGGLTLERITEDGAVFLFEGREVEVGVLEDWN